MRTSTSRSQAVRPTTHSLCIPLRWPRPSNQRRPQDQAPPSKTFLPTATKRAPRAVPATTTKSSALLITTSTTPTTNKHRGTRTSRAPPTAPPALAPDPTWIRMRGPSRCKPPLLQPVPKCHPRTISAKKSAKGWLRTAAKRSPQVLGPCRGKGSSPSTSPSLEIGFFDLVTCYNFDQLLL